MKSIFDRSFRYTSSAETDLRRTFARVRRRIREEEELRALAEAEAKAKVSPIKHSKNMAM
jgi:DNA transposition AAA+ family ATPase